MPANLAHRKEAHHIRWRRQYGDQPTFGSDGRANSWRAVRESRPNRAGSHAQRRQYPSPLPIRRRSHAARMRCRHAAHTCRSPCLYLLLKLGAHVPPLVPDIGPGWVGMMISIWHGGQICATTRAQHTPPFPTGRPCWLTPIIPDRGLRRFRRLSTLARLSALPKSAHSDEVGPSRPKLAEPGPNLVENLGAPAPVEVGWP